MSYAKIAGETGGYANVKNSGLCTTKIGYANYDAGSVNLTTSYASVATTPASTLETIFLYSTAKVLIKFNSSTKEATCPAGVWTQLPLQVKSFLAKATAGTPALIWYGYY